MASFGLSRIGITPYNDDTKDYTKGFALDAVETTITPQWSEGSLYSNNRLGKHLKLFSEGDLSGSVDSILLEQGAMMYGHTLDAQKKKMIYKTTDVSPMCGYAFVVTEAITETKFKYYVEWVPMVQFTEDAKNFQTREKELVFKTHKFTGKIYSNDAGEWYIEEEFDTLEEANARVDELCHIGDTQV